MKAIGKDSSSSLSSFLSTLINIGWYAAAIGLALAACLTVASLFIDLPGSQMDIPASFILGTQTLRAAAPSLGILNAEFETIRCSGNVKFTPPSRAFLAFVAGGLTLFLALTLWVLGQLRAVFRTLRDGQPFVSANATRIRRIAYAVIVGELARSALMYVGSPFHSGFSAPGLLPDWRPDINFVVLLCGLIVLAIAEVFREGTRLNEEQSLTV
jgi:Protein of unknown function (DUF2975)